MQDLRQRLPADAILANGAGNFAGWAHRFFRYTGLRTQLAPTCGSMGYGVPAAIAAKLAAPEKSVVCLAGDGDFLMTGQELATAAQYRAGIVVIVFNNGMYGTIRMHQEREFPGRVSATALDNPDFVQLAQAYRAHAARVQATAEFAPALDAALAYTREKRLPALIELACDPQVISPGATIEALRRAAGTGR